MKNKKLLLLPLVLIVIQFIRPARNIGESKTEKDISHATTVPIEVASILEKSCYDCHSNNSTYLWYFNMQPLGWWLQHHINEGKEELNFSEFASYSLKRQKKKLKEIAEQLREKEMPMSSYTLVHTDAKISDAQIDLVANWANDELQKIEVSEKK
jgi:hypothetical protein